MQQTFRIDGMHCGGCVTRVTRALQTVADDVTVTLEPPQAQFDTPEPLTVQQVQAAVAKAGDYTVS